MNTIALIITLLSLLVPTIGVIVIIKRTGVNIPSIHLPHGLLREVLFWGPLIALVVLGITKEWPAGRVYLILLGFFILRFIIVGDVKESTLWGVLAILGVLALFSIWGSSLQKRDESLRGFVARNVSSYDEILLTKELQTEGKLPSGGTIGWSAEFLCYKEGGMPEKEWTNNFDTEIKVWSPHDFSLLVGKAYGRELVVETGRPQVESGLLEGAWRLKSADGVTLATGKVIFQHRSLPLPSSGEEIRGRLVGLPVTPISNERFNLSFYVRPRTPYLTFLEGLW